MVSRRTNVKSLCVCNPIQSTDTNKVLTFIKKQFRNIQSMNYNIISFISCRRHEITFIFLKLISNLSLYLSDRYDKNLSLVYIWSDVYLNVLFLRMKFAARLWAPNGKNKQDFGPQNKQLGPQIFAGDLIA